MEIDKMEKEWGNPAPWGLGALAMICFCFFALLTGRAAEEAHHLVFAWGTVGAISQIAAGIINFKRGDVIGGTIFATFGALFMLGPALGHLMEATGLVESAGTMDGYVFILLSLLLWCYLVPASRSEPLSLFALIALLAFSLSLLPFVFLAIGPTWLAELSGWLLLISGLLGVYIMTAIMTHEAYGRFVLPVGPPLVRPKQ